METALPIVVTLDGPAGAGKSTAARQLADQLGFRYLDTGAMYRTLSLIALERGVSADDGPGLAALAESLDLRWMDDGSFRVGERELADLIRKPEVSAVVSPVSAHAAVRDVMVKLQRKLGTQENTVCEGRDMGSVVFPDALVKVYLDAAPSVRVQRRFDDLSARGLQLSRGEVGKLVAERDRIDSSREFALLRRSKDQILLETTKLSPDEVVSRLVALVEERLRSRDGAHP